MEEVYIKCLGCGTVSGVFIDVKQSLDINCGVCKNISKFGPIVKEEFTVTKEEEIRRAEEQKAIEEYQKGEGPKKEPREETKEEPKEDDTKESEITIRG